MTSTVSSSTGESKPARVRSAEQVSFSSLTPNNLGTIRKLNSVLFPIKYSEQFYRDILSPDVKDFCQLIYLNDIPVGTICCRVEKKDDQHRLYLMTMGVLSPYRSRKIGSKTLEHIVEAARAHTKPSIASVYLHVQVSNEDAKRFYERHGFKETGLEKDYYKKITPRDAWILELEVQHLTSESGPIEGEVS